MPFIHLKTNRLEYKFEIHGKYTIIKGDSGAGKTTFYQLVITMNGAPETIRNMSDIPVIAIPDYFEGFRLEDYSNCVMVLDENCSLFKRADVASVLQSSDNYFVIINRDLKFGYLPVHVDNVFRMKASGKFHTLEKMYKRFTLAELQKPEVVITEDLKSGYYFLKEFLKGTDNGNTVLLEPAYGDSEDRNKNLFKLGVSKIAKSVVYYVIILCRMVLEKIKKINSYNKFPKLKSLWEFVLVVL